MVDHSSDDRTEQPPKYRLGYVPGVFDMFHVGHLNMLRQARQYCDAVIAGVVSDENAQRAKGRPPVVPLVERLEIVAHCDLVDRAYPELVTTKFEAWQELGFDVIVKGDDWRGSAKGDALEREFAPVGVDVVYLPYTVHTSSTMLRRELERRDAVS